MKKNKTFQSMNFWKNVIRNSLNLGKTEKRKAEHKNEHFLNLMQFYVNIDKNFKKCKS